MPDRNQLTKADAPASSDLNKEGLRPRWTQDEAIAFACARDYIAELQAIYATALDELKSQPDADPSRLVWLCDELALLRERHQGLRIDDEAAITEIRRTIPALISKARADFMGR